MSDYFIGTSGWYYDHWEGLFYPQKLPRSEWLEFYAGHFTTVEVNNSFYHLPSEKAVINWRYSSPDGFVFAVKVSRYVTHIKRLKDVEESLQNFISRVGFLQDKLGPLLFQLPPNMKRDDETLKNFLNILSLDKYFHVLEFRHESWLDDSVFGILRQHNVGLCVFDAPEFSCPLLATADFAYVRFHGSTGLYSSCYSDKELRTWLERISILGRSVASIFIFF